MNEFEFTKKLVERLQATLTNLQVETGKSLFYTLNIDELGNIPLKLNQKGEPLRGRGVAFEQDIVLFERVDGQTSIVPRVVVEIKFGGVTTHDAIVYSEKANRIRNIYPYLRYGLVLGDMGNIPPRVMRLGLGFDFIMRISSPPKPAEMVRLISLLVDEVETSRKLGRVFSGAARVSTFTRRIHIDPDFELPPLAKPEPVLVEIPQKPVLQEMLFGNTYYIYENWRAEKKAVIHYAHCRSCNNGKGIHPNAGNKHGCWHGPFASFAKAEDAAQNTGREVRVCKNCGPV